MEEPDHETLTYEIIDFIHRYQRTNRERPTLGQVLDYVNNDSGSQIDEEYLRGLQKVNYISFERNNDFDGDYSNHRQRYRMKVESPGRSFHQNGMLTKSLDDNRKTNEDLISHQKKSSAVETLFTIALLSFSFVQVGGLIENRLSGEIMWFSGLIASMTFVLVLRTAWIIGGENLIQVVKDKLEIDFSLSKKSLFLTSLTVGTIAGVTLSRYLFVS